MAVRGLWASHGFGLGGRQRLLRAGPARGPAAGGCGGRSPRAARSGPRSRPGAGPRGGAAATGWCSGGHSSSMVSQSSSAWTTSLGRGRESSGTASAASGPAFSAATPALNWRTRVSSRRRAMVASRARSRASSSTDQPSRPSRRTTWTQTDWTTSAESNLARSWSDNWRRTRAAEVRGVGVEQGRRRLHVAAGELFDQGVSRRLGHSVAPTRTGRRRAGRGPAAPADRVWAA